MILGYIVRGPVGGMTWHHLQYVIGMMRLGHDVVFVEDSDDYPSCYNPVHGDTSEDASYGIAYATEIFVRLGIPDCWTYYDAHTHQWLGPASSSIQAFLSSADILVDVSGVNPVRSWMMSIPVRILIDTDPVFTQIKHLSRPVDLERAAKHTHFFSFGENIGSPYCSIPDDGFIWLRTRQPIVLDLWPSVPLNPNSLFTTVMQWDSYKEESYQNVLYGMKSQSFSPYMALPKSCHASLELALGSSTAPRSKLQSFGWSLRDPLEVTKTPWTYQAYIAESKAEFSVAKHGYVVSNSGWFSERSACYLASGRPVITQDTGFSSWLTIGHGVIAFTSFDEAVHGIEQINNNLSMHHHAALEIAAEFFDSGKVLEDLLSQL
ncbi:hypothetical protein KBY82_09440 [Cyanobium sp. AMD-g]|uniref:hypothetical protein n=1 Tax=Cyanobium sp. AMD-g TaxID=2823699 RepID=UPI0020CD084E|nr:hypothetical protein [Cyanobium sp. AMD-g]MCP9931007.1 hypothetical protein [Cyanobium sp. AMD-g]